MVGEWGAAGDDGFGAFDRELEGAEFGIAFGGADDDGGEVVEVNQAPTKSSGKLVGAGEFGGQDGEVGFAEVEEGFIEWVAVVEFPMGGDQVAGIAGIEAAIDGRGAGGEFEDDLFAPIEESEGVAAEVGLADEVDGAQGVLGAGDFHSERVFFMECEGGDGSADGGGDGEEADEGAEGRVGPKGEPAAEVFAEAGEDIGQVRGNEGEGDDGEEGDVADGAQGEDGEGGAGGSFPPDPGATGEAPGKNGEGEEEEEGGMVPAEGCGVPFFDLRPEPKTLPMSQRMSSACQGLTRRARPEKRRASQRMRAVLRPTFGRRRNWAVLKIAVKPRRPKPARTPPWVLTQSRKRGGKARAKSGLSEWARRRRPISVARKRAVKI